jgi:hypothetical protein
LVWPGNSPAGNHNRSVGDVVRRSAIEKRAQSRFRCILDGIMAFVYRPDNETIGVLSPLEPLRSQSHRQKATAFADR